MTKSVLVCSGDDRAVAAFMVGVDRIATHPDGTDAYRTGEALPVISLSRDVPFVVFSRSVLEVLTFVDRSKLVADDEKDKEALMRELDPDSAALYDAQKQHQKTQLAALAKVDTPVLDTLSGPGHGNYL